MTDYAYSVQYKAPGSRPDWVLSECVQSEWKDSIMQLLKDIKPRDIADEGSYRIVRRPKDDLEVME